MMRRPRTPQTTCGQSRAQGWWQDAAGHAFVLTRVLLVLAVFAPLFAASNVFAQDPSILGTPTTKGSSFGNASMFGKINKNLDKAAPLNLQGDQLIYDTQGNRVIARGNVEIFYNDYILTADEVIYDQNASTLTAVGNVTLKEPQGNIVRADRYTLTDDFRDGFVQSLSIETKDDTRITAEQATRREGNVTEFRNGRFTPCKSDGSTPPLWCLSAARIIHDKDAQTITYQDATFDVYGQPILYLPYFQHADPTVKRKSGLLTPTFGQSKTLGFMTQIPYYFALAPNYDFTFQPGYLSKQGIMWDGEWRHRLANGEYTVRVAGIDQDWRDLPVPSAPYPDNRQNYDGWRGTVETRGQFSLSSWWKFGWDVTLESDDQFRRFYKFDNILVTDRVNQIYLIGQSDRSYFAGRFYHFGGLLLDDTAQSESYAHPIIDHNYVFTDPVLGGELRWDSNLLSFTRPDGATLPDGTEKDQDIQRLTTELKWRRRFMDQIGITYTPFAQLRADAYQFNDFTDPESVQISVSDTGQVTVIDSEFTSSDTTLRGIATGGATVSYPWVASTPGASHIIEPIGQIVARQDAVTQRRLPNEDARSLIFDDTNLFEVTKFSGFDRIEMGTRVNAGVQYTFQAFDGGYARFLAGQSYHLAGDNVYANPGRDDQGNLIYSAESGLETDRSDYVLGAYIAPTDSFRLISQSRFDQSGLSLRRQSTGMNYAYGPFDVTGIYSYAAADTLVDQASEQQEIQSMFNVQLTDQWSAGAGMRYDIDESQVLSDFISVRYADECFVLTATYSESYYNSDTIQDDRTLMLRFELKHLGEFKYASDTLDFAFGGQERTN